ncbi:putative membrane protein [Meyerozyma sp. JA9]|nr:putative membrane protein [Meyerozyma sp. JA9]
MKLWSYLVAAAVAATATATAAAEAEAEADAQSQTQVSTMYVKPVPHLSSHHHGVPILETDLKRPERAYWEAYNATTFFTVDAPHKGALYVHVGLISVAMVMVYPLCMVMNNVESAWYLATLTLHSVMVVLALLNYSRFMQSAPDLYPGNAYTRMSWILFFSTSIHWFFALLKTGFNCLDNESRYAQLYDDDDADELNEGPSTALFNDADSFEIPDENEDKTPVAPQTPHQRSPFVARPFLAKLASGWARKWVHFFGSSTTGIFQFFNWGQFFFHLVYIPTGVAVLGCFGRGNSVFNMLAHFIKGGIFFSLGLLYLARYCGAYAGHGWAWNHKFVTDAETRISRWARFQSTGLCTMEMVESSLILVYGCTNIFLEHLANPGGAWTAKDLQHVSIAFIYIGCGLCGVITECKLADWRYERAMQAGPNIEHANIVKASPGFSPNPFPIITVFWTGFLMSKHEQASHLSTEIHTQWGNLFIYGCGFRFLTYILHLATPPEKDPTKVPRSITELIVSFSLLCGGLIFMESCDPIVLAFEYRGFTSMFTLNISLGVVTLLMAWEIGLFAIKDRMAR